MTTEDDRKVPPERVISLHLLNEELDMFRQGAHELCSRRDRVAVEDVHRKRFALPRKGVAGSRAVLG